MSQYSVCPAGAANRVPDCYTFFFFFFLRVDGILFCGGVVVNLFAGAHIESAEFQTTTASYKLRINWT